MLDFSGMQMTKLIPVIAYNKDNAATAERLCDAIYQIAGAQRGHCLLVSAGATLEQQKKVQIAAEVAFESVDAQKLNANTLNATFRFASSHIAANYRWPFVWLEPGCVPVKNDWLEVLADAYDNQPKRYLGPILVNGDARWLARQSVYSPGVFSELSKFTEGKPPFEVTSANDVVPKATKTSLIQFGRFETEEDFKKVRKDAVLVVGDRSGLLLEHAINTVKPAAKRIKISKS
jgi:hypothetical protein